MIRATGTDRCSWCMRLFQRDEPVYEGTGGSLFHTGGDCYDHEEDVDRGIRKGQVAR